MGEINPYKKITGLPARKTALVPSFAPGQPIELTFVPVDALYTDQRYQRGVGQRGAAVVRQIVEQFCWAKFQPICVVRLPTAAGKRVRFAVLDGQHRAIAAVMHPAVSHVPAYVVCEPDFRKQADIFTSINRVRTAITPTELYYADLAAGDAFALKCQAVLDAAGVLIQKTPRPQGTKPRHTLSVGAVKWAVRTHGAEIATEALKTLAEAKAEEWNQLRGQAIKAMANVVAKLRASAPEDLALLADVARRIDFAEACHLAVATARKTGDTALRQLERAIERELWDLKKERGA